MSDETAKPRTRGLVVEASRDLMVLGGAACVSYGAWLAWRPAGFIVAGLFLLVPAVIGSLRSAAKDGEP